MSENISKKKREHLVNSICEIRKHLSSSEDSKKLSELIDEIERELRSSKFGLVFEKHQEYIDEILEKNTTVYCEDKELKVENKTNMNFIIEGDNLAALKLLEKTHKGKIDYIYIDPPYNTKSKDFRYDDKIVDSDDEFKHSKWLSFMEKRLNLAKVLLKSQGCIMISINEEEVFGLKLLCDQIFGYSNYLAMFSVKVRHEERILKGDKDFHEVMEYMLMYRKSNDHKTNKRLVDNTSNADYVYQVIEKVDDPEKLIMDGKKVCCFKPGEYEVKKVEAGSENLKKINIRGSIKEGNSSGRFFMKHLDKYIGVQMGYLYRVDNMGDDKFGYRYFLIPESMKRVNGDYFQGVPQNRNDIKEVPYPNYITTDVGSERYGVDFYENIDDEIAATLHYLDFEPAFNNVGYEGGIEFRNGKKPIAFLEKCFEMGGVTRNKDALILDFFAGSGSSAHALMKINDMDKGERKFILVNNNENEICRNVTYERVKKVIKEEKYDEGVKYFRIDYVATQGKVYYEYTDELLDHVKELVEIENGLDFENNSKVAIILSDEELRTFIEQLSNTYRECEKIYVGFNVLASGEQEDIIKNNDIEVNVIPDYYYRDLEE